MSETRTNTPTTALEDVRRFNSFVERGEKLTDCMIWKGASRGQGYGLYTSLTGEAHYAHKYAFFNARGRRPSRTIHLTNRTCGNRLCVNWRHYKSSEKKDPKGGYKLSLDKVKEFRYTYRRLKEQLKVITEDSGVDLTKVSLVQPLAKKYNISRQMAYDILNEKVYKEVE